MGVRKQVFASRAERENFYKLRRRWGEKYLIYHNLPFLTVFTEDSLVDLDRFRATGPNKLSSERFRRLLSGIEVSRLKKTSIDYTLCDLNDQPLVCVEFDGLQNGVNIGTRYYPSSDENNSEWRQTIMDLKLTVAHGSLFPFFVVGSDHFQDLPLKTKTTIVDGVIGDVLANRAKDKIFSGGFKPEDQGFSEDAFNELDRDSQNELIQDWMLDIEVLTELEHNPVSRAAAQLMSDAGLPSYSVCHKFFPRLPDPLKLPTFFESPDLQKVKEWVDAWKAVLYHGATVALHTQKYGDVQATVMLPNFQVPGFGSGLGLAEEIAKIMCLDRLGRLRQEKPH
jgi:hypothetical protein